VFDRAGEPIAAYDIAGDHVVATDPSFAPIVETFAAHAKDLGTNTTIETTLDPVVQNAALEALHGYRGALVAIDPRTNELLAIALTHDVSLESQFEPGSVIKILTGLNAIQSGIDLSSMFPYDCKGALEIDGRRFGDWVPNGHGKLASLDEAFAVSCNVVFADIGLRLGVDRLRAFMTAAGFNGQTDLGVFKVLLGRTVEPVPDRFETAFFAIGLQHETITAMHLAMIASMVANRGVLTTPRLVRSRHSILGDLASGPPPQPSARLASATAAETMIRAMQAVITDPRGTGRRAEVAGVTMALKTGTSGSKHNNALQALIAGFAPVESPRIAFAVIGEDAGPAEFAGAKIAHDFVAALKSRGLL
jgi:peptidoglycan glycosyltransferase